MLKRKLVLKDKYIPLRLRGGALMKWLAHRTFARTLGRSVGRHFEATVLVTFIGTDPATLSSRYLVHKIC